MKVRTPATAVLDAGVANAAPGDREAENARLRRERSPHTARHGVVVSAIMLIALMVALCALATPAGAIAAGPPSSAPQVGRASDSHGRVLPGAAEAGQLNVGMLMAVGGFALAVSSLMTSRPRLARRRAILRFRSQLEGPDVASLFELDRD